MINHPNRNKRLRHLEQRPATFTYRPGDTFAGYKGAVVVRAAGFRGVFGPGKLEAITELAVRHIAIVEKRGRLHVLSEGHGFSTGRMPARCVFTDPEADATSADDRFDRLVAGYGADADWSRAY